MLVQLKRKTLLTQRIISCALFAGLFFLYSCQNPSKTNSAIVATDVLADLKTDPKLGTIVTTLLNNNVNQDEILNLGNCIQLTGLDGVGAVYLSDLTDALFTCADEINFSIVATDRIQLLINKALLANAVSYVTNHEDEFTQTDSLSRIYRKLADKTLRLVGGSTTEELTPHMNRLITDTVVSLSQTTLHLTASLTNMRPDAVIGLAQGFTRAFVDTKPEISLLQSFIEATFSAFKTSLATNGSDLLDDADLITKMASGVTEEVSSATLADADKNTLSQAIITSASGLSSAANKEEIQKSVQEAIVGKSLDDFAVSLKDLTGNPPSTESGNITFLLTGQYATHFSISTTDTCTTSSWSDFPSDGKLAYTIDGTAGIKKFYFQAKRDTGDGSETLSSCLTISVNYLGPDRVITFSNAVNATECHSVSGFWKNNQCLVPSIANATTSEECHAQSGYWYSSSCHNAGITCSLANAKKAISGDLENCATITQGNATSAEECHAVNAYWYSSACNSSAISCLESNLEIPVPGDDESCQTLTIANATTSSQCTAASGSYYGGLCHTAAATKLVFTAAPGSLALNTCSTVFTVQLQNSSNSAVTNDHASSMTFTLSPALTGGGSLSGTTTYYTDSGCTSSATLGSLLTLANGQSSKSFYIKHTVDESVTFTASGANLTAGTTAVSVTDPSAPISLVSGAYKKGTTALRSCKAYKNDAAYSAQGNGLYWLDPDNDSGTAAIQAYCDMTNNGGGWTLVALQYDSGSGPVIDWDQGVSTTLTIANSFAFSSVQLPGDRTEIAWGKYESGTTSILDYATFTYTTGNIAQTTITGTLRNYHIHRDTGVTFSYNDPDQSPLTDSVSFGDFMNALTIDRTGSTGYDFGIVPKKFAAGDPGRVIFGYGGTDSRGFTDGFAAAVFVR